MPITFRNLRLRFKQFRQAVSRRYLKAVEKLRQILNYLQDKRFLDDVDYLLALMVDHLTSHKIQYLIGFSLLTGFYVFYYLNKRQLAFLLKVIAALKADLELEKQKVFDNALDYIHLTKKIESLENIKNFLERSLRNSTRVISLVKDNLDLCLGNNHAVETNRTLIFKAYQKVSKQFKACGLKTTSCLQRLGLCQLKMEQFRAQHPQYANVSENVSRLKAVAEKITPPLKNITIKVAKSVFKRALKDKPQLSSLPETFEQYLKNNSVN